jgi:DNA-binding response OmpR family regulator
MPNSEAEAPRTRRFRVLLVDDEADFSEATAGLLTRRGFEVLVAGDGTEGLRLAAEAQPDAVILDIRMPGLDGIEVLRRLKRDRPALEVIILTGHAAAPSGIEGMRHGAFDYLTKPVPLDDLVARLDAACARLGPPARP